MPAGGDAMACARGDPGHAAGRAGDRNGFSRGSPAAASVAVPVARTAVRSAQNPLFMSERAVESLEPCSATWRCAAREMADYLTRLYHAAAQTTKLTPPSRRLQRLGHSGRDRREELPSWA